MKRTISGLALGIGLALAQEVQVLGVFTLPPTPIQRLNPHLSPAEVAASLEAGWPTSDRPALGSGLFYLAMAGSWG